MTLTHISLCSGYGGIDMGLERALGDVKTIAYSEIEGFPIANLVSKMEEGLIQPAPIWSDLKTFPWESFKGKVNILSGGFPCQPFSVAGSKKGDEDPRHLWPYLVKGFKIAQPQIVFFENVANLASLSLRGEGHSDLKGTPVLLHIMRDMERAGYDSTWCFSTASKGGAPHHRKRIFLFGLVKGFSQHEVIERLLASSHSSPAITWVAKPNLPPLEGEPPMMIKRGLGEDYLDLIAEVKILGNGVVPFCAEDAFKACWRKIVRRTT